MTAQVLKPVHRVSGEDAITKSPATTDEAASATTIVQHADGIGTIGAPRGAEQRNMRT